jgi:TolA-binding protein
VDGAQLTAYISLATAILAGAAALWARAQASKLGEVRAVKVTVDAAGNVVDIINAQLTRSAQDVAALAERLNMVEEKLVVSEGKEASLRMQLGKMRKRIDVLEGFIRTVGHEPPPETET